MSDKDEIAARFIAGHRTVELVKRGAAGESHRLALRVDGRIKGEVELSSTAIPEIAVDDSYLFVTSPGGSLWALRLEDSELQRFDFKAPVVGVYRSMERYWVVCESFVALWDPAEAGVRARCEHDEVILQCWWTEGRLTVEDLQSRVFDVVYDETSGGLELVPSAR